jgi:hypothetical protein
MVQKRPSATTIRTKLIELSEFVSSPKVLVALGKAGKNKQLLRKAKTDPKGFFRDEGVTPPRRADVTISQIKRKITVKACYGYWLFQCCAEQSEEIEIETK